MYLDVTSYMLTVLTFSVGFLSTRRHAHFDVLAKDLADRSWKIRQALNAGQDLGPRDLAEDVASVTVEPDSVAKFARIVNASFFIWACVVVALGLLEYEDGHTSALLIILFVSTVLVFALGEYDVRWMVSRENELARGTILGQLAVIDQALRCGDGDRAKEEITRIRESYPNWVLGRELELALIATNPTAQLRTSDGGPMDLVKAGATLHAAPVLAAEHQLRNGNPIGALQDFQIVLQRTSTSRTVDRLQTVLGFAAGLPVAVFCPPGFPPRWLEEASGLELGLSSLPTVRRAAEALSDFGSDISLAAWLAKQPQTPTWLVARAATVDADELPELLTLAKDPVFNGALNSLGIVFLARGRDVDALRIFEAAIRMRPNSATSHWGRAIACHRREWHDAALQSLRRAESLDPTSPRVMELTRAVLEGQQPVNRMIIPASDGSWTTLEAIQVALLGQHVSGVERSAGARRELADIIVQSALQSRPMVRP